MERWSDLSSDLALFALVARHGGLSAAARASGIPKSRLSRRLMQLEDRLGARLVERSSRRFAVTGLGQQILGHAEEIGASTAAAEELAAAHLAEPRGLVRIACPLGLERGLTDVLVPLLAAWPALRVQVLPRNRPVDLIEEHVDIALRVRPELEAAADFQVRQLARTRSVLVAAPGLAADIAGDGPTALEGRPTVARTDEPEDRWTLECIGTGARYELRHRPRFTGGSFEPLLAAARAGLGVALMPESVSAASLAAGTLVRVLPGWGGPESTLYLVHVSRRAVMRSVRVVIDALAEGLALRAL